jgi:hypothetical protein
MRPAWCTQSAGGGERHEEEGEGDEKPDGAARHESLPRSRTCGGILRAMCWRGKSNFAESLVQIRGDDS